MSNFLFMMQMENKTFSKKIAIVLLFFSVLLGLRWAWSEFFPIPAHPPIVNGVLDLRGMDLDKSPSFPLDGQWKFYPEALVSHQELQTAEPKSRYIQVPGDWSDGLSKPSGTASGYGTYRLRILMDPIEQPVSFWFKKIQASSSIEINGVLTGGLGKIDVNANEYKPKSVSYTSSYSVNDAKEIDVLIQVANFEDP